MKPYLSVAVLCGVRPLVGRAAHGSWGQIGVHPDDFRVFHKTGYVLTPNVGRFHTSLDFCGAMSSSTIEREVHAIRRADRDCDTALEAMARNKTTRHKVLPATLHAGAATAGPGACAQRDLAQVVSNLRSWLGYRARDGFRWMGRDGAGDRRPICGMRRWPLLWHAESTY